MSQLQDRTAVITGASRGIGRAIALELSRCGATIVINYRDANNLSDAQAVLDTITSAGGKAIIVEADVSTEDGANALIKGALDAFDKIDILVNNAGITRDNLIMMMKPEDFDLVMSVNLRSTWLCSRAAVRSMMRKRYGRIINIASVSGVVGQAGQTNYSASKAGIIGFTKSVALELGSRNIRSNAIAPGFIETEMTGALDPKVVEQWREGIPLKRGGTPTDVANACVFLGSDLSAYITGQTLHVCGGMLT